MQEVGHVTDYCFFGGFHSSHNQMLNPILIPVLCFDHDQISWRLLENNDSRAVAI